MGKGDDGDSVSVLYALPDEQAIVVLPYKPGMTAEQAVASSGLAERYRSIREHTLELGVFGVAVDRDYRLKPGDRVEISRPLRADPRAMRRQLLDDGRVMGGAPAAGAGLRKKAPE